MFNGHVRVLAWLGLHGIVRIQLRGILNISMVTDICVFAMQNWFDKLGFHNVTLVHLYGYSMRCKNKTMVMLVLEIEAIPSCPVVLKLLWIFGNFYPSHSTITLKYVMVVIIPI